ncbi:Retinol dehydrogenase 8 [Acropora cervicornis]|uniref:Retinol dehydrogenase 8 n=1 Tax=Acropora cervicornis TaxID=6130 RepID=A0AAD9QZW8_ACRCE|nr:Retinol dehydrogenase 8 [Acropora cervicornis]
MAPKVVVISGCSSGIGLSTALHLAKDAEKRFKVYATMRNLSKKGQLEDEGEQYLGNTLIVKQMDVSSDESVKEAVEEILETEGKIDVLFNNAGLGLGAVLESVPIDMAKALFEVNFFGALRLIQAVLPSMKARQSGHIINNSSHFGIVATPFSELYSASKFALEGLSEGLAPVLAHFNIRCSILEPGPVDTQVMQNMEVWTEKYEKTTVDQKSLKLHEEFMGKLMPEFARTSQSGNEVAEIVKSIILSPEPSLRYPTNKKFFVDLIEAKLAEIPGDGLVKLIATDMAAKVVLISGCSSGIGLSTALLLAKDAEKRFKVYATMRNLSKKGQLEDEGAKYLGNTLIVKQMDVSSDESVKEAVKEILETEGKIDVLFNNAGLGMGGVLESLPVDMAKELFEVNFFGALRLIQAVLPSMKARQSGHIINNSSHFGIVGTPFNELYSASKFALEGLSEGLAPVLAHFNIRCSILEPGPVDTQVMQNVEAWTKKYEKAAVDQKSLKLQEEFMGKLMQVLSPTIQSGNEIAEIVKSIILSPEPSLRYPTNKKFFVDLIEAKLAEIPGDGLVKLIGKNYLPKDGIGLSTALLLAKDAEKRFKVYATMRNLSKKGQLESEGEKYLGNTLIVKQMDVSSDESVKEAVKEILQTEGKIDVLFNNAGLATGAILDSAPIDMAKELFEVNFFGALRLIQAVLPSMKARQSGHIINNSSHFGIVGTPFNELYSASKFALEGLSEGLAPVLAHFNIRCSILEPGPVDTSMGQNMEVWTQKYEKTKADQKSLKLHETFMGKLTQERPTIQSGNEIAEVVKSIILSPEPSLRYPTNKKFFVDLIEAKLAEIPGNELVKLIDKNYLAKE